MGNIKTYPVIFTLVEDGVLVDIDLEEYCQKIRKMNKR